MGAILFGEKCVYLWNGFVEILTWCMHISIGGNLHSIIIQVQTIQDLTDWGLVTRTFTVNWCIIGSYNGSLFKPLFEPIPTYCQLDL